MLPKWKVSSSICPVASAKQANRFTLDPQWTGIRTGATYRFWTGHALTPCQNEVFASAKQSRRNRNLSGQMAAPMSVATGSPCPIRGRVQSATGRVRVQSVTASASASFPWAVHVRDRDRAANVRVLAVGRPCPDTWLAGKCPRCGLAFPCDVPANGCDTSRVNP